MVQHRPFTPAHSSCTTKSVLFKSSHRHLIIHRLFPSPRLFIAAALCWLFKATSYISSSLWHYKSRFFLSPLAFCSGYGRPVCQLTPLSQLLGLRQATTPLMYRPSPKHWPSMPHFYVGPRRDTSISDTSDTSVTYLLSSQPHHYHSKPTRTSSFTLTSEPL